MDHYIAHNLYTQLYDANVTTQGTVLETEAALHEKIDEIVTICKEHFQDKSVTPLSIVHHIHKCLTSEPLYDSGVQQYIIMKCLEIVSNID